MVGKKELNSKVRWLFVVIVIVLFSDTFFLTSGSCLACSIDDAGMTHSRESEIPEEIHPYYSSLKSYGLDFEKVMEAHFSQNVWVMRIKTNISKKFSQDGVDSYILKPVRNIFGQSPLKLSVALTRISSSESDCTEQWYPRSSGEIIGVIVTNKGIFNTTWESGRNFLEFEPDGSDFTEDENYRSAGHYFKSLNEERFASELAVAEKNYRAKKYTLVISKLSSVSSRHFIDVRRLELMALSFHRLGKVGEAKGLIEFADLLADEFNKRKNQASDGVVRRRVLYNLAAIQAMCDKCRNETQTRNNLVRFAEALTASELKIERKKYFELLRKDADFERFRSDQAYFKALTMLSTK
jgi:hypothetical protein